MKIAAAQIAEFINQMSDAYYYEDTSDDLWDRLLVQDGRSWKAVDPAAMVEPEDFFLAGFFACNKTNIDPLNLDGKNVLSVLEKWLADQASTVRAFRIPNDKVDAIVAYLQAQGVTPL